MGQGRGLEPRAQSYFLLVNTLSPNPQNGQTWPAFADELLDCVGVVGFVGLAFKRLNLETP